MYNGQRVLLPVHSWPPTPFPAPAVRHPLPLSRRSWSRWRCGRRAARARRRPRRSTAGSASRRAAGSTAVLAPVMLCCCSLHVYPVLSCAVWQFSCNNLAAPAWQRLQSKSGVSGRTELAVFDAGCLHKAHFSLQMCNLSVSTKPAAVASCEVALQKS